MNTNQLITIARCLADGIPINKHYLKLLANQFMQLAIDERVLQQKLNDAENKFLLQQDYSIKLERQIMALNQKIQKLEETRVIQNPSATNTKEKVVTKEVIVYRDLNKEKTREEKLQEIRKLHGWPEPMPSGLSSEDQAYWRASHR